MFDALQFVLVTFDVVVLRCDFHLELLKQDRVQVLLAEATLAIPNVIVCWVTRVSDPTSRSLFTANERN